MKRNRNCSKYFTKQYAIQQKDVFTFKDLERLAPKSGIIPQSVKEVLEAIVADGLVETDKIGAGVFYWAFPSKAMQKVLSSSENQYEGRI